MSMKTNEHYTVLCSAHNSTFTTLKSRGYGELA